MKPKSKIFSNHFVRFVCVVCIFSVSVSFSKTRWSSLCLVPDADLLGGGEFHVGYDGYIAKDTGGANMLGSTVIANYGITEWVNVHAGYAGGFTCGFKARILGETRKYMPSLAIGAHNLFFHKEANYFGHKGDSIADDINNEFFVAVGKSVEQIKTRFHMGIQTIPSDEDEWVNPFLAVEKYFGLGIYSSFELYRRDRHFHMSLFATWRAIRDMLEISVGAVDLKSMFVDNDNNFEISLDPSGPDDFVRPGVWFGIRFHSSFNIGKMQGLRSVEDRLASQEESIRILNSEVDSLRSKLSAAKDEIESTSRSVESLSDSITENSQSMKMVILDRLVMLKSLYDAEPFEPDKVRQVKREISSFREQAVSVLKETIIDPEVDRYIRIYAIEMLGEMGNRIASESLINLLAKTDDPDVKIEIIIALGKMRETRVMYLLEQLANDPNDAIAITAQEVLLRLAEETGARISPNLSMRRISSVSDSIPEKKIIVRPKQEEAEEGEANDSVSAEKVETSDTSASKGEEKTAKESGKTADTSSVAPSGESAVDEEEVEKPENEAAAGKEEAVKEENPEKDGRTEAEESEKKETKREKRSRRSRRSESTEKTDGIITEKNEGEW